MIPTLVLIGALSTYSVGDGYSGLELACGGRFKRSSHHVAIREWKGRCGLKARVCVLVRDPLIHARCRWTTVRDSGPWGAVDTQGNWHCWPKPLPKGWRRRAVVDLTYALWVDLGKPRFLSPIRIEVFRRKPAPAQPPGYTLRWDRGHAAAGRKRTCA